MQKVFEMLIAKNKPIENDVAGLLGLMMIAGIDLDEKDFFKKEIMHKLLLPKRAKSVSNLVFNSQPNLSALLFGITIHDVRKPTFIFP